MLLKKGAEANLFLENWHNRKVILKKRLSKGYRNPQLDINIRRFRTIHESQLLHDAKLAGVSTPTIFMVDLAETTINMQYIDGVQVKQILNNLPRKDRILLCQNIGKTIGRLHKSGIIHGDLTTSNMILTPNKKIYFVDFGLGEHSNAIEARGVDLHLMKRAFQSTHYKYVKECFEAVTRGYSKEMGEREAGEVFKRIREIEIRGRYIAER
jgi:TP53 regulating kinase-like protein